LHTDPDHVILLGQYTQLLGLVKADAHMGLGDRGLFIQGQIQDAIHPWQVYGQRLALRSRLGFGAWRLRGLGLGNLGVELLNEDIQFGFVKEGQLFFGDPIRLRSEAPVAQQF